MKLVWIKPGPFDMGQSEAEGELLLKALGEDQYKKYCSDESPHKVEITKGFYMQATEATVGQFCRFVKEKGYRSDAEKEGWAWTWDGKDWVKQKGSYWDNPGFDQDDQHPVTCVSYNDAGAFIDWLNTRGKEQRTCYRLPTEAEWEFGCRADTKTAFYTGETISTDQANYDGNYVYGNGEKGVWRQKTTPVAHFPANPWGLYDMHGNVSEWRSDWYGDYPKGPVTDPTGPAKGARRVLRGGSWNYIPHILRAANRDDDPPGNRIDNVGFRVVVDGHPGACSEF